MDALDRAAIDGFLDLLLGGSGGVVDFREVFIIQTEDFRAGFDAKSARDTFIRIDHGDFAHTNPPF
jgi:hypothetical protein